MKFIKKLFKKDNTSPKRKRKAEKIKDIVQEVSVDGVTLESLVKDKLEEKKDKLEEKLEDKLTDTPKLIEKAAGITKLLLTVRQIIRLFR